MLQTFSVLQPLPFSFTPAEQKTSPTWNVFIKLNARMKRGTTDCACINLHSSAHTTATYEALTLWLYLNEMGIQSCLVVKVFIGTFFFKPLLNRKIVYWFLVNIRRMSQNFSARTNRWRFKLRIREALLPCWNVMRGKIIFVHRWPFKLHQMRGQQENWNIFAKVNFQWPSICIPTVNPREQLINR